MLAGDIITKSVKAGVGVESLSALQDQNLRLQRAVEELSVLNELALDIGSTLDLDRIMRRIVQRALRVSRAEEGVITIVDDAASEPCLRTIVRTRSGDAGRQGMHPPDALIGWMQLNLKATILDLRAPDSRFDGVRWPDGVQSALVVPLVVRGRLTGMMTLYNKEREGCFTEEDRRLLSIIASQSAQVLENARLLEDERAHARMQEEVRLARRMQLSLLPASAPVIPGLDVAGTSIPAREVGGDYFDFVKMNEGRWALAVGDVVGKGLPAALLMANLQATLRAHLGANCTDVSACLARVNDQLCHSTQAGTFASLVLAVIEPETGIIDYANAGHNRPLLTRRDGAVETLSLGGLVLGVKSGIGYEAGTVRLADGDMLVMFSDGVTEAMDAGRSEFGDDSLEAIVRQRNNSSSAGMIDRLLASVQQHVGDAEAHDDLTLVICRKES
jgi:phosphoserine phosphatase RsbU/P